MMTQNASLTKDDLIEALKGVATKDDISDLREELKTFVTKDDLKAFATKNDIAEVRENLTELKGDFSELKGNLSATRNDLKAFSTKDELNAFRDDFNGWRKETAVYFAQLKGQVQDILLILSTQIATKAEIGIFSRFYDHCAKELTEHREFRTSRGQLLGEVADKVAEHERHISSLEGKA